MQPLFTIGIASYNYAVYMKKALQIIKNQSFKDYEILISDDCSTDNSIDIVKEFMNENPHIQVRLLESEKNQGLVANKNKIIENSKGKYLMLCDADDWMADNCLQKLAEVIERENPDRIISQVAHVDKKGKIIQVECIPDNQTKWGWNLHHGSACKVSILKKYNIRIQKNPDDVYFTIDLAKHCQKISCVREILYFWLVHTDSEGRKKNAKLSTVYVKETYGEVLRYITQIMEEVNKENNVHATQDIEELGLVRLKLYYFYILFIFQNESYHDKIKYYQVLHQIVWELDKKYLDNKYISQKEKAPIREYPMRAIRLCSFMERWHLMPIALLGYHIVTKFKYFDQ